MHVGHWRHAEIGARSSQARHSRLRPAGCLARATLLELVRSCRGWNVAVGAAQSAPGIAGVDHAGASEHMRPLADASRPAPDETVRLLSLLRSGGLASQGHQVGLGQLRRYGCASRARADMGGRERSGPSRQGHRIGWPARSGDGGDLAPVLLIIADLEGRHPITKQSTRPALLGGRRASTTARWRRRRRWRPCGVGARGGPALAGLRPWPGPMPREAPVTMSWTAAGAHLPAERGAGGAP